MSTQHGLITALCRSPTGTEGVAAHFGLGNQHYVSTAAPVSEPRAMSLQFGERLSKSSNGCGARQITTVGGMFDCGNANTKLFQ